MTACRNRLIRGMGCLGSWAMVQSVSQQTLWKVLYWGERRQGARVSTDVVEAKRESLQKWSKLLGRAWSDPHPSYMLSGDIRYPQEDLRARKYSFWPWGLLYFYREGHLYIISCILYLRLNNLKITWIFSLSQWVFPPITHTYQIHSHRKTSKKLLIK